MSAERYSAYVQAAELMRELVRAPGFTDFLTVPAYERVLRHAKLMRVAKHKKMGGVLTTQVWQVRPEEP